MENKQKTTLVFLFLLLATLIAALYLSRQRQEIRKKAAGCSISFDTALYPPDKWRRLTSSHYQVLTSTNNQLKIHWECDSAIGVIRPKDGNTSIGPLCKTVTAQGLLPCAPSTYCIPVSPTSGEIICENLPAGRHDVLLEFYTVAPPVWTPRP